jgi:ADP-heptose:LPS heptosyltransferase
VAAHPLVLFVTAGFGDSLLSIPTVRALASVYPNRLALICRPGARELYSGLGLAAVHELDWLRVIAGEEWASEEMRSAFRSCDVLLCLDSYRKPPHDVLFEHVDPLHSVGFFPPFEVVVPAERDKHEADLLFEIPRHLDPSLRSSDFARPPPLEPRHRHWARNLRRAAAAPRSRVLVVHADTQEEKMWPRARWAAVLDLFLARHPEFVTFVVGLRSLGLEGIASGRRVVPLCRLGLAHTIAVVGESDLFCGVDSCMLHAADLFGVPGVGLFGPTDCRRYGFRFTPHVHVCGHNRELAGEPEFHDTKIVIVTDSLGRTYRRRRHTWANGNMEDISEEAVFEALESLASNNGQVGP